jgi:hypothetical protein
MFLQEAEYIYTLLEGDAGGVSPIINIGSSTEELRTQSQPWVDARLFRPLRERGVELVHVDLKSGPGVDVTADLLTDEGFALLRGLNPKTVLLCNVLEHTLQPALLASRAFDLLPPGGKLVISVPRSYPYHRDPIDTMFRPDPQGVAALVPSAKMVCGVTIPTSSYWNDVKKRPWILLRQILRAPFPFLSWTRYKRTMKKLYWLVNPYLVTVVVLQKA